jgi:hypothetical protein
MPAVARGVKGKGGRPPQRTISFLLLVVMVVKSRVQLTM